MNQYEILGIVGAIVAATFLFWGLVLPWAIRKGLPISGLISATNSALDAAKMMTAAVGELSPGLPYMGIIELVIGWGKKAAEAAEQLYLSRQLPKGERKKKAKELVYDMLRTAKIEITPELEAIVDGAIEAGVLTLPPTN